MSDTPLVSVIIPTRNRPDLLKRAVASVLAQTYKNFELVIVDDASDIPASEQLAEFRDNRIRYISNKQRQGQALATNRAITASSGKYIAFLDDDDEWFPQKLEKQAELFSKKPDLGLVYCGMEKLKGKTKKKLMPSLKGLVFKELLVKNKITGTTSAVMIPRGVLDDVGYFDPMFPARKDLDLYLRITRTYEVDFVPEVMIRKRLDGTDRISKNQRARQMGWLRLYSKYKQDLIRHRKLRLYLLEMGKFFEQSGSDRVARICYRKAKWAYLSSLVQPNRAD